MTDVDNLWITYKQTGTAEVRDRLILHYASLVRYVASQVATTLPHSIEQSDLVSYGIFGLIDAVEKFDTSRGVKFETYALSRIKGSIIDELRSIDWVPRSVRARAKAVERTTAWLEAALHRVPTASEVAAELEVAETELQHVFIQVSLDETFAGDRGEAATLGETVADRTDGPDVAIEVEHMREVLAGAINRLSDREKTVFAPYYFDGLTLAEIGELLGVTESRVCQIHTRAVLQLRAEVGEGLGVTWHDSRQ